MNADVNQTARTAVRGHFIDFVANPALAGSVTLRDLPDGVMLIDEGRIVAIDAYTALQAPSKTRQGRQVAKTTKAKAIQPLPATKPSVHKGV